MKKILYVFSFVFFGLTLATITHAVIEIVALEIIFENPDKFAHTLWWQNWAFIHKFASIFLWVIGFVGGIYLGFKWWEPYGSKPGFYHWKKDGHPPK